MKKLLLAASALALAATMSPAVISSVQAQSLKSPYCNLAKGQKNLVSWNGYYHCIGPAPQASRTVVRARPVYAQARPVYPQARPVYAQARPISAYERPIARRAQLKSPYCNLAKGQKNLVSWNSYYGCIGPAPQASRTLTRSRPVYAQARPVSAYGRPVVRGAQAKSPYCNLAKGQKNLVSWNSYYGCIGPAPQASRTLTRSRPVYAQAPVVREQTKSPYCAMAKGQKNLVSWNAYYGCLGG